MNKSKDYKEKLERIMDRYAPGYFDCETMEEYDEWNDKYPCVDYFHLHVEADDILCDLLNDLGYQEVVEYFKEMPKQYE